jgi:signal transduction histidine kinase
MRRSSQIILLILFVTILLIGLAKFFIDKDTIQTQKSRLEFFSENLTIHKNNILISFRNSASLIYSEINRDSSLSNLLNSASTTDSIGFLTIRSKLEKHTLPYFDNLNKVGFSSLTFIFKRSETYNLFNTKNGICTKSTSELVKILPSNFNNIPLYGTIICNGSISYQYIFPLFQKNSDKPFAYVLMGIDLQKMKGLIAENLPENEIGFLVFASQRAMIDSIKGNNIFTEFRISENVFIDHDFEKKFVFKLSDKIQKQLLPLLIEASTNIKNDQFSIYHRSKNYILLSLSKLDNLGNDGFIYVVASRNDPVMDKTKEKNNQMFIIIVLLLLISMTGTIYHFKNRVNLLKEKTNIENSEMKLKELNQSKDKFFAILAHDLKNPFNGIMGMSGYLNESYDEIDDSERKEIINDINISSKNAFNLLQNLLEWTRAQSGLIKNIPVKIEPKSIIDLSLETVLTLAKNKDIEILQVFQTTQNGYADENLISTVLRNLFTNAVKFSSRNSKIKVIVKQFENELVFCIIDSGIGLTSDEIDKLFRIDLNFHKKGTENETGTGLGLKICKEFVEYCKGRIWVVSEPQVGSSFFFTIPIYQ